MASPGTTSGTKYHSAAARQTPARARARWLNMGWPCDERTTSRQAWGIVYSPEAGREPLADRSAFDRHQRDQLGDWLGDARARQRIHDGTDPLVGVRRFLFKVCELLIHDVPPHLNVGPAEVHRRHDA